MIDKHVAIKCPISRANLCFGFRSLTQDVANWGNQTAVHWSHCRFFTMVVLPLASQASAFVAESQGMQASDHDILAGHLFWTNTGRSMWMCSSCCASRCTSANGGLSERPGES